MYFLFLWKSDESDKVMHEVTGGVAGFSRAKLFSLGSAGRSELVHFGRVRVTL